MVEEEEQPYRDNDTGGHSPRHSVAFCNLHFCRKLVEFHWLCTHGSHSHRDVTSGQIYVLHIGIFHEGSGRAFVWICIICVPLCDWSWGKVPQELKESISVMDSYFKGWQKFLNAYYKTFCSMVASSHNKYDQSWWIKLVLWLANYSKIYTWFILMLYI